MATDHNFKVKNGLTVQGETLVVNHTGDLSGTQVYIKSNGTNNLQRWGTGTNGNSQSSYRFRIDQNFEFIGNSGSGDNIRLKSSDGSIDGLFYKLAGTTVIDSSRNLTNIGTISSGGITVDLSTDSAFVTFERSGSEVGKIFHESGTSRLTMGTGNSGLTFIDSGQDRIVPRKSGGGNANASIDLGDGASQWRELYLSNGLRINGTTVIDSSRNLTNIGTISSSYLNTTSGGVVSISTDGSSYASGMSRGALEIGSTARNYRYTSGWSGSMQSGILANTSEDWEFMVHDAGDALGSIFVYESANNAAGLIRFGRNAGYGVSNAVFDGTITSGAITSSGTVTAQTAGSSLKGPVYIAQQNTTGEGGEISLSGSNGNTSHTLDTVNGTFRIFDANGTFITGNSGYGLNAINGYRVNGTQVINASRVVQSVTLGHSNTGARFETNDWMYDTGGKARFYFEGGGRTFFGSDNGYVYRDNSDTGRATISNYGGINLLSGGDSQVGSTVALAVGGTTTIDSSRNITGQSVLVNNGLTVRNGNTNAAVHIASGDNFCGIGWNRNVSTGAIYDSDINAFQMHIQNNVLEIETYNGSGTTVTDNAWTLDTSGNMGVSGNLDVNGIIDNTRNNGNVAAPNTSDHTAGTRISFYDTSATAWYAMGIESDTLWFNSDDNYKWYQDAALRMSLIGDYLTVNGNFNAVGNIELDSHTFVQQTEYSGTSIFSQSGDWYTLAQITEQTTPGYFALKFGAHSTVTFSVTTGYVGSNVATINVLGSTWTQNGGYPGASELRIVKQTDNNNYYVQMRLTYSTGPTGFSLFARTWGGTPSNGTPGLVSSLSAYSATHSTISHVYINYNGTGSSTAHYNNNGSNTYPSYSFSGDTNTGMYRDVADSIGFATNGTLRTTISNSGLDVRSSGTLKINGTDVIDSSRNVIATSFRPSVDNAWKIRGNSGNANLAFEYSTSSGLADANIKFELTSTQARLNGDLYFTKSPDPRIYAGSNVGLNIDGQALYLNRNTNSNILVGSGSAPATLSGLNVHMGGSSYILASDGTRSAFMGADSSGYAMFGSLTNHDTVIRTNNTERLRVATNGNVTFKGETLTFHGSGSDTYTSTALYINQAYGVLLEGSLQSNSSSATKNPLVFTWRGNWNTQGGIKVEAGKTTVDSLAIKSGNSSTTVIDSSRNLSNINLVKFRDHTGSFYISPTNSNTLNAQYGATDDTADMWINYRGYADGFTKFRDFRIGDGKGTELFFVDGSDRTFRFGGSAVTSPKVAIGNVTPTKNLHVYTPNNEGIFLQGTGGGVWMDVQSNSSQLWSMGADGNGWAIYNRNNNTYRLRCENGNDVDIVSGGLKVGGTTVIDSSRNITASTAVIYGGADNKLQLRETTSGTVPWNYIEYRNSANTRNAYIGTNTSGDFQIYGETGMSLLYTNMNFTAGGVTNSVSGYQVNGTTVIDSSRQLFDVSVSEPEAEYGQSLNGNFGQWLSHSYYASSGFNADVAYWGWNFVQGSTNAPHTSSSQWYRNRVSLGNAYGHGVSSGDYWLEMAYPRYGLSNAGHMYIRSCESGSIGSWYEVGSNIKGNQSVGGSITAAGNITAYSDERLKSNIQTLDGSKVLQMRGVSFTKNEEAGSGVIAQELEKIAPELVHDNEDGYKSVAYGNLTGYLIEAIKEQQEKIEKLEELVEKLISEK